MCVNYPNRGEDMGPPLTPRKTQWESRRLDNKKTRDFIKQITGYTING